MSPKRLTMIRESLGWTGRGLARHLACSESFIRKMEAGSTDIPAEVAVWLDSADAWLRAHPPPPADGWMYDFRYGKQRRAA